MTSNYQTTSIASVYYVTLHDWHDGESFIADLQFIRCVTATKYYT